MTQTTLPPLSFPIGPEAGDAGAPLTLQLDGDGSSGRRGDTLLLWLTRASAAVILLLLVGLVGVLSVSAVPSIKTFGAHFLVGREWRPNPLEVPKRDAAGNVVFENGEMVIETLPPSFGALP